MKLLAGKGGVLEADPTGYLTMYYWYVREVTFIDMSAKLTKINFDTWLFSCDHCTLSILIHTFRIK